MGRNEHRADEGVCRSDQLDQDQFEGGLADRQRARKGGVFTAGAVGKGGGDHHVAAKGSQAVGQGDCQLGVGRKGEMGPMLLGRSDRDGDQGAGRSSRRVGPGQGGEIRHLRQRSRTGTECPTPGEGAAPGFTWRSSVSPWPFTHSGSGPSRGSPV